MLKKWLPGLLGLGGLALLGRVAGFLREVLMASKFGATSVTDAYLTTLILFDLAIAANISIISGTLSYLSGSDNQGKSYSKSLLKLSWISLFVGLAFAFLLFPVVDLIIPYMFDYKQYATQIIISSTKILLVLISFVISCGILSVNIQLKGKLSVPGGLTIFVNGFSILSMFFLSGKFGIISIPIGLIAGIILFFVFQYRLASVKEEYSIHKTDINYIPWLLSTLLVFANLSLPNITSMFERYFALGMIEGTFSHYSYAIKLGLLPLTIFGYAVSTSLLPIQTRYLQENDEESFKKITSYGLLISIVAAGLLISVIFILANPIVKIIYEHGNFTFNDTISTATTLRVYSLGLFPFMISPVLANVFYAKKQTRLLVIIGIISILINVFLLILFTRIIPGSTSLAMAAVISGWINLFLGITILSIKKEFFLNQTNLLTYALILFITIIICLAAYGIFNSILSSNDLIALSKKTTILLFAVISLLISTCYLIFTWLAIQKGSPEVFLIIKKLVKKFTGKSI
jgi:putative peptidoglycan lipid II flippase